MNVTVDKFGRIVIPKPVRDRLGFTAGTELRLETGKRELLLRAVGAEPPLAEEDGLLVATGELSDVGGEFDTVEHIRTMRRNRIRELSSPE